MYRLCCMLIFVVCIVFANIGFGQSTEATRRMKSKVGDHRLQYLLQSPSGKKPEDGWPLLLFLHGRGECGDDIAKVKIHGPPKLRSKFDLLSQCVLVSPQCPKSSWWRVESLKGLVEEVIADRGDVDESRIYLTGLSMGGYGSWSLLSRYPEFFRAAIPICGGKNPFDLPKKVLKDTTDIKAEFSLDGFKKVRVPIWTFHGMQDKAVPIAETENLVQMLKDAGHENVKFTVYPEAAHVKAWQNAYNDPATWKWLFSQ